MHPERGAGGRSLILGVQVRLQLQLQLRRHGMLDGEVTEATGQNINAIRTEGVRRRRRRFIREDIIAVGHRRATAKE